MKAKRPSIVGIFLLSFFLVTYLHLLFFYLSRREANTNIQNSTSQTIETNDSTEKVSRVIDGDTFEIEGGIKVRLIGIDTPEMKNKDKTIDCFAQEAKNKLTNLILGKDVILVKDVSETDKYGRLLRYVYLGDQMINDTLVREGFAKTSTFPPDVKYVTTFISSEEQAQSMKSGLWSVCK